MTADDVPDIHVKTPLQRAIQLLKRHRDIRFCGHTYEDFKPISMIITVLSAKIYNNENTIYDILKKIIDVLSVHAAQIQDNFCFDEVKSRDTYTLITRKLDGTWFIPNPTNYGENFADKWHQSENGIPHARAKAFFQWVTWAKEDFFSASELCDENYYTRMLSLTNKTNSIFLSYSNNFSFDVVHRQQPPWLLTLNYPVRITAKYKKNLFWKEFDSKYPLDKNLELLFTAQTSVPPPFQVYWQVVNTGKEAEDAKQLRGEILPSRTAGIGGIYQKEHTAYTGTHWIQCFIVKNNVCVARSSEFVVKIK